MLSRVFHQLWHPDVAIDLGTAYTRVAFAHRSLSFEMPSVCGARPALREGVVIDPFAAAEVLRPALWRIRHLGVSRPRALACAPSDTTAAEREAVKQSCYAAGAGAVALMPEPVAAAIGAGINVYSAAACCVLDIGDGVTDCAIIRNGRLVHTWAERVACSDLHRGVQRILRERCTLDVSLSEARRLAHEAGVGEETLPASGYPVLRFLTAHGQRWMTGEPTETVVPFGLLHENLRPLIERIVGVAATLLAAIPAEERDAVRREGLHLTGGGALLPGMRERIAAATGVPVHVVPNPLQSVVGGAKRTLSLAAEQDLWKRTG
jgi:rod shape-determining protein MreB and related proteins